MNCDSDVDDSELIHKCQKSIFYLLIYSVMLTECKRRNSDTTKNMGCVVNVCTQKQLMDGIV